MLVKLISDMYYDTPSGTLGYVLKKKQASPTSCDINNPWHKHFNQSYVFIIQFPTYTEVVEQGDFKIIQRFDD